MQHPVDIHVGKRIRHRRWAVGSTQQSLAEAVGIRFQQIQKYETGANRVSASRLWDIASTLRVPVSFFFEGLGEKAQADAALPADLLRVYYNIPEAQRRKLYDLARALSDA